MSTDKRFNWWNYGLDNVSDTASEDWAFDLAEAVIAALEPVGQSLSAAEPAPTTEDGCRCMVARSGNDPHTKDQHTSCQAFQCGTCHTCISVALHASRVMRNQAEQASQP